VTRKTLFHGYIESLLFLPIYSRWPHLLVNHSPLGKADSLDAGCWDNRSRCRIRRDRPSFSHRSARAVLLGIIRWGGRLSTWRDLEAAISAFESTLDRGLGSVWPRPPALLGPSLLIMADRLGRLGGALALPSSAGHQ